MSACQTLVSSGWDEWTLRGFEYHALTGNIPFETKSKSKKLLETRSYTVRQTKPYGASILESGLKTSTSYDVLLAGGRQVHIERRMVADMCQGSTTCCKTHGRECKNGEKTMSKNVAMSCTNQNGFKDLHNN